MKKVLPLIIALFLSSTTSASSVTQQHGSWQQNQGILDRAAKKIKKEDDMKREAIQAQAKMTVEAYHMQQEKDNYNKNYKKAEIEASKIMQTTNENELQGLQTALIPAVKQEAPKPVVKQTPMSLPSVFVTPPQDVPSVFVTPPQELPSVFVTPPQQIPSVFVTPTQESASITNSVIQRMKNEMNAKLDQHAPIPEAPKPEAPKPQPVQTLVTMPQPQKKAPVEALNQVEAASNDDLSVTSLMSQYTSQKKNEQEVKAKDEQAKMAKDDDKQQSSFEKSVMYGSEDKEAKMQSIVQTETETESTSQESTSQKNKEKEVAFEPIEDNPISQMMALKHPEMQKQVEDATIEYMSQSHNSAPMRQGVLM